MKLKDILIDAVGKLVGRVIPAKGKKSAVYLTEIFAWQEICSHASTKLEEAWVRAHKVGVVPADDEMRKTAGETIIAESDRFSCVAKVSKPRETFDRDKFINEVMRVYKLEPAEHAVLMALVERCKVPGKAALSKRVLEA